MGNFANDLIKSNTLFERELKREYLFNKIDSSNSIVAVTKLDFISTFSLEQSIDVYEWRYEATDTGERQFVERVIKCLSLLTYNKLLITCYTQQPEIEAMATFVEKIYNTYSIEAIVGLYTATNLEDCRLVAYTQQSDNDNY